MTSKHREQDAQKFLTDIIESCLITNNFVNSLMEQWQAIQSTVFETPETKRRREQDFLVACEIFIEREREFKQICLRNREEEAEEELFLEEKLAEERERERDFYRQQDPQTHPHHGEDKNFKEEKSQLDRQITDSILFLTAKIAELDQIINELTTLEKSIDESIQKQLYKIDDEYHKLFDGEHKLMTFTMPMPQRADNSEIHKITLEISTADICDMLREHIPRQLQNREILPHQVAAAESRLIEQHVAQKLRHHVQHHHRHLSPHEVDQHVHCVTSSPRFATVRDGVVARIQAKKAENPAAHVALQSHLAVLAAQQQDLACASAAVGSALSLKERLIKKREQLQQVQAQGLHTRRDLEHARERVVNPSEQHAVIQHQGRLAEAADHIRHNGERAREALDARANLVSSHEQQQFFQPANPSRGEGALAMSTSRKRM